jgi:hypothetical protein
VTVDKLWPGKLVQWAATTLSPTSFESQLEEGDPFQVSLLGYFYKP